MAIKLAGTNDQIKVILKDDSAVGPKADYAQYLETLDEAFLDLQEGQHPTRFVMRKVLPYDMAIKIEDSQMTIKNLGDGEPELQINPSYMLEELRCALVAVEQHESIPPESRLKFGTDAKGCATQEFIASLHAAGYATTLSQARKRANRGGETKQKK